MSPLLLSFSANLSFQKRHGAKSGQYTGCRTAKPFYSVLTMVYDIQNHTLFGLPPSYTLKHNTFHGQVWSHFKVCFLQNKMQQDYYLHCN